MSSQSFVITGAVAVISPRACVELGPALVRLLENARTNGAQLDPETEAAIEAIDTLGAAWRNGWRGASTEPVGTPAVPNVDPSGSEPRVLLSVEAAANELDISARAVRKRMVNGSLTGEKVNGSWRVDAQSVRALKEKLK